MTAEEIQGRWPEIVEQLKAQRQLTAAALLAEVDRVERGPDEEEPRLTLVFRYEVLADKWSKSSSNSAALSAAIAIILGIRFEIGTSVDESARIRLAAIRQAEVQLRRQSKPAAGSEWQQVLRITDPSAPALIVCPGCRNGTAVELWETVVGREGPSIGLRCSGCGVAFRLVVRALDGELCLGVDREDKRDSRRAFNREQRRELWLAAGGRCTICRIKLGADWHADHVKPHSRGGRTEVGNGQALCNECNRRKRDAWDGDEP